MFLVGVFSRVEFGSGGRVVFVVVIGSSFWFSCRFFRAVFFLLVTFRIFVIFSLGIRWRVFFWGRYLSICICFFSTIRICLVWIFTCLISRFIFCLFGFLFRAGWFLSGRCSGV